MHGSPLQVCCEMRVSRRTQYEIGALLGAIGLCFVLVGALRFDAFVDSDQRFRKEFEPYLITYSFRESPDSSAENYQNFLHRKAVYDFYPSGSPYSRCAQMVVTCSGGLMVIAMGVWICLRARRRRDEWA